MKANELRIGNYVDIINRSVAVHLPMNIEKQIGELHFFETKLYNIDIPICSQTTCISVPYKDLSPIKLTEEWLIKFGFEYDDDEHYYYKSMFDFAGDQCEDFIMHVVSDDKNYFSIGNKETYIPIEYVNQLQNLYFALTGEELKTIKNKFAY